MECCQTFNERIADVAELVDALDSKSSSGNRVGVRFPPSVRMKASASSGCFFDCPGGEIGRRARFRCVCFRAWGFESPLGHVKPGPFLWPGFFIHTELLLVRFPGYVLPQKYQYKAVRASSLWFLVCNPDFRPAD